MIRSLLLYLLLFLDFLSLAASKRIKDVSKSPLEIEADRHFETLLNRLSTFPLHRHQHQHQHQHQNSNDRRLSDHLNDETTPLPSTSAWTIQGATKPLFVCPSCLAALEREQLQIIDTLALQYPTIKILAQTQRIFNGVYIELPYGATPTADILPELILKVLPQRNYVLDLDQANAEQIGASIINETPYCYKGDGMKIGVLDTGIDYTHQAFGGPGTLLAYQLAYGLGPDDVANQQRDGLFPTDKVVDGVDFLGEDPTQYVMDDDPIDALGHGTAVASAILAVAPNAQLVAIKVCNVDQCPDFALVAGIEYLLDPNKDGNPDDRVDVINLSLGSAFDSAYYDVVAFSLELANFFGAVVVTSSGNVGNIPYSAGAVGSSPNTISVGATNAAGGGSGNARYMARYSSRGPGDANWLKPDLCAPGDNEVATVGSGTLTRRMQGTSFSAPLVAGAAALLRQKCPECSPLAIRSILMNTADRNVRYSRDNQDDLAPITRMGSGEVRIDRAMEASVWAYSLDDFQPTIGLGLVDAHVNLRYTRQIVIFSLSSEPQTIRLSSEFRSQAKRDSGAVEINFDWEETILGGCDSEVNTVVSTMEILIFADKAPANTMTTSGTHGFDPEMLDRHEFDGHIIVSLDDEKEIAVPFHMILRQAAAPILGDHTFLPNRGVVDTNFTIINEGAGVAQIDAFELIYSDIDEREPEYGLEGTSADIRSIGYRTVPVGEPTCDYLIEFNFQTWERVRYVGLHTIRANVFVDTVSAPITMWIPPLPAYSETYIVEPDGTNRCTGLSSDHSSNTVNTIMRACSNDLGLEGNATFYVRFQTDAYPISKSVSWLSGLVKAEFPNPKLQATSYDIGPGETFEGVRVMGEIDADAYGIQFVANSFRDFNHTGAATVATETLNVVKQGIILESEVTPDIYTWPGDENRAGPQCQIWSIPASNACTPSSNARTEPAGETATAEDATSTNQNNVPLQEGDVEFPEESPACPPIVVPRVQVPTDPPTEYPSPNPTAPTSAPSHFPSFKPRVTGVPTALPLTEMPSSLPVDLSGVTSSRHSYYWSSAMILLAVTTSSWC
jgi:hypothetical protein